MAEHYRSDGPIPINDDSAPAPDLGPLVIAEHDLAVIIPTVDLLDRLQPDEAAAIAAQAIDTLCDRAQIAEIVYELTTWLRSA